MLGLFNGRIGSNKNMKFIRILSISILLGRRRSVVLAVYLSARHRHRNSENFCLPDLNSGHKLSEFS